MWKQQYYEDLYHAGIKGMKWGVRRYQRPDGSLTPAGVIRYRPTSIAAARARGENSLIDNSEALYKTSVSKAGKAIELGKAASSAKLEYEKDKTNTELKKAFRSADKQYKSELRKNTNYQKGVAKSEISKDLSEKYLNEGKKIEKALKNDPRNKTLQKAYNKAMSKYDIERAKSRNILAKAERRRSVEAVMKINATASLYTLAATGICAAGAFAVNKILKR